jgi:death-on-curing protein
MRQIFVYIETIYAIQLHDKIIEISWWLAGIKNVWLVDSVLAHIQNDDYYPTFEAKLTHLMYGVAMNHAFEDWNKRTALQLWSYFIGLNYTHILADGFIPAFENIVVHVVNHRISKMLLLELITAYMQWEMENEEILMKIYYAIQVD